MIRVTAVKKNERRLPSYWLNNRERKSYYFKPRLYVSPKGETILENLAARHFRPITEYRKLLPEIFRQAGIPAGTKAHWSQYAGCSCPCSPGFVLETAGTYNVYADVEEV